MSRYEQTVEMFRVLREPPTADERKRWESTRLLASIWACGDDEYDGGCYQPQIVRKSPNREVGYPWLHHELVWEGTFVNEPTPEEYANLAVELREGAALHGITLIEEDGWSPHGEAFEAPA